MRARIWYIWIVVTCTRQDKPTRAGGDSEVRGLSHGDRARALIDGDGRKSLVPEGGCCVVRWVCL